MREFETGATRNNDKDELDYRGFLSPLVMRAFAEYMHENRYQADGKMRASDNWKKGIPLEAYMSSGWRHFMDWYLEHEGHESREGLAKALCGLLFNVQGYLHTLLATTQTTENIVLPYVQLPDTWGKMSFERRPKDRTTEHDDCDDDHCQFHSVTPDR